MLLKSSPSKTKRWGEAFTKHERKNPNNPTFLNSLCVNLFINNPSYMINCL